MYISQILHACFHVIFIFCITIPCTLWKFCNLIPFFFRHISNWITDSSRTNHLINIILLASINHLIRSFSRNSHDITLFTTTEAERTVSHSFFQGFNLCNFFLFTRKRLCNNIKKFWIQLIWILIKISQLLQCINLQNISFFYFFRKKNHFPFLHCCIFPKWIVISAMFFHFTDFLF